MATLFDVYQAACSHAGVKGIASVDESTPQALTCRTHFLTLYRALLSLAQWPWAVRRATVKAKTLYPPGHASYRGDGQFIRLDDRNLPDFRYRYPIPEDYYGFEENSAGTLVALAREEGTEAATLWAVDLDDPGNTRYLGSLPGDSTNPFGIVAYERDALVVTGGPAANPAILWYANVEAPEHSFEIASLPDVTGTVVLRGLVLHRNSLIAVNAPDEDSQQRLRHFPARADDAGGTIALRPAGRSSFQSSLRFADMASFDDSIYGMTPTTLYTINERDPFSASAGNTFPSGTGGNFAEGALTKHGDRLVIIEGNGRLFVLPDGSTNPAEATGLPNTMPIAIGTVVGLASIRPQSNGERVRVLGFVIGRDGTATPAQTASTMEAGAILTNYNSGSARPASGSTEARTWLPEATIKFIATVDVVHAEGPFVLALQAFLGAIVASSHRTGEAQVENLMAYGNVQLQLAFETLTDPPNYRALTLQDVTDTPARPRT